MIVMKDYYKQKDNREILQILGFGLDKIFELNSDGGFDIIFQKGIGIPLIQNVLELCKEEILEKKQGNSVIPIEDFMII